MYAIGEGLWGHMSCRNWHLCDLAFLSDILASGDYLTFWVKKRHEESTMKRWKWWIMVLECQQMLCVCLEENIYEHWLDYQRLKDHHLVVFLKRCSKVCFKLLLIFLILIKFILGDREIFKAVIIFIHTLLYPLYVTTIFTCMCT